MYVLAGASRDLAPFPELTPLASSGAATLLRRADSALAVAVVERGPWTVLTHGVVRDGDPADALIAFAGGEPDRLSRLDGSFAIVGHHRENGATYAATDRHATLRMFYACDERGLAVFPRVDYFRRLDHRLELSQALVFQLVTMRGLLDGRTPLAGVRRLPPATVLAYAGDRVALHRYWRWDFSEADDRRDPEDLLPELEDRFTSAVDRLSDDRTCIAVSGGLDSRAILATLARRRPADRIETVTFGSAGTLDFEIGVRVARRYATRVHELRLDLDPDAIARRLGEQCVETDGCVDLINAAHGGFDPIGVDQPILVGALGDKLTGKRVTSELLGQDVPWSTTRSHLLGEIQLGGRRWLPKLLGLDVETYEARLDALLATITISGDSPYRTVSSFDCDVVNPVFELACITKGSELRPFAYPFLDRAVVELWSGVPPRQRCAQALYLRYLMTRLAEAYRYPVKNRDGAALDGRRDAELDAACTGDRHVNYVPWGALLRGNGALARGIAELVSGATARGFVDRSVVEQLRSEHARAAADHSFLLVRIASLEQIARSFADV